MDDHQRRMIFTSLKNGYNVFYGNKDGKGKRIDMEMSSNIINLKDKHKETNKELMVTPPQ